MNIQEMLYSHLKNSPGVAAVAGARIYPLRLPQEPTLPAITYQRVDAMQNYVHSGPTSAGRGLVSSRFQVSCWALTYAEAITLSEAVKAAMDVLPDTAFIETQADMYEPETSVYHIPVDVIVWYKE